MGKLSNFFESLPKIKRKGKQPKPAELDAGGRLPSGTDVPFHPNRSSSCGLGAKRKKCKLFRRFTDGDSEQRDPFALVRDDWVYESYQRNCNGTVGNASFLSEVGAFSLRTGGSFYEEEQIISCRETQEMTLVFPTAQSQSFCYTLPTDGRPQIRTNPWFNRQSPQYQSLQSRSALAGSDQSPNRGDADTDRRESRSVMRLGSLPSFSSQPTARRFPPATGKGSLEDSVCSSGYGSHDSSPESSVHTPDWNGLSVEPKVDKSTVCDLDELASDSSSDSDSDTDFCDYCEVSECGRTCLSDLNGNPVFRAPPPPPLNSLDRPHQPESLSKLNAKMVSLRAKSGYLRSVLRRAKEEREQRLRQRQICMEQTQYLRDLKWVIHSNFQLDL